VIVAAGKRYGRLVKKTQKKNKSATTRTKIDGESSKIPVNPEDEEDFIPETGTAFDVQKKYVLRTRIKKSSNRKVRFRQCWHHHALYIVDDSVIDGS
jgi:hypothetical protein